MYRQLCLCSRVVSDILESAVEQSICGRELSEKVRSKPLQSIKKTSGCSPKEKYKNKCSILISASDRLYLMSENSNVTECVHLCRVSRVPRIKAKPPLNLLTSYPSSQRSHPLKEVLVVDITTIEEKLTGIREELKAKKAELKTVEKNWENDGRRHECKRYSGEVEIN